jgi:predicted nucleic acid-binding protein
MIAVDTSSLVHYLAGSDGADVDAVEYSLAHSQACLPPVVLSEVLSDPKLRRPLELLLLGMPVLELTPGFWERAGRLRARLIGAGHKAALADTLIAQSCLDHDLPLISRDADFLRFVPAGLQLVSG